MPSSVFSKVVPSRFTVLDSDIAQDGSPVSALLLRQLAGNANRLLGAPQLLFNFAWDSGWSEDELATGLTRLNAFAGYTNSLAWTRILGPIRVPKKSVATSMHVRFFGHFSKDTWIQWVTSRSPFLAAKTASPATASTNVQFCPATTEERWQLYGEPGLALGGGSFETISAFVRGDPDEGTVDSALYGSPVSGPFTAAYPWSIAVSGTPTWLPVGSDPAVFSIADGSCYLALLDANRVLLVAPRKIVGVYGFPQPIIQFEPSLSGEELDLVNASVDSGFEIRQWGNWRFANVAAYTEQA